MRAHLHRKGTSEETHLPTCPTYPTYPPTLCTHLPSYPSINPAQLPISLLSLSTLHISPLYIFHLLQLSHLYHPLLSSSIHLSHFSHLLTSFISLICLTSLTMFVKPQKRPPLCVTMSPLAWFLLEDIHLLCDKVSPCPFVSQCAEEQTLPILGSGIIPDPTTYSCSFLGI